jgi:dUTP pyrophosphatase
MCIISGSDLKRYLTGRSPVVSGMISPKSQVSVNGIDLTIRSIQRFIGKGCLGVRSEETRFPKLSKEIKIDPTVHLRQGCYKIKYNEKIQVPTKLAAIARPRSTLLRLGATVETALWDSGYTGRSESLLTVHNRFGIDLPKNARVVQLVFMQTTKRQRYKGRYGNENL